MTLQTPAGRGNGLASASDNEGPTQDEKTKGPFLGAGTLWVLRPPLSPNIEGQRVPPQPGVAGTALGGDKRSACQGAGLYSIFTIYSTPFSTVLLRQEARLRNSVWLHGTMIICTNGAPTPFAICLFSHTKDSSLV